MCYDHKSADKFYKSRDSTTQNDIDTYWPLAPLECYSQPHSIKGRTDHFPWMFCCTPFRMFPGSPIFRWECSNLVSVLYTPLYLCLSWRASAPYVLYVSFFCCTPPQLRLYTSLLRHRQQEQRLVLCPSTSWQHKSQKHHGNGSDFAQGFELPVKVKKNTAHRWLSWLSIGLSCGGSRVRTPARSTLRILK